MHLQQFSPFLVISSSVHVHNTRSRVNSQIKVTSPCSIVGETNVGLTALQHSVVLPNSCEANISGVQRRRWARIFPNLHEAIPWSRNYVDENEHEYFQISSKLFHEAIPWSYNCVDVEESPSQSMIRWYWRVFLIPQKVLLVSPEKCVRNDVFTYASRSVTNLRTQFQFIFKKSHIFVVY